MPIAKNIILGLLIIFFMFSLTKNYFEYKHNLNFYNSYKSEYLKLKEKNNILKAQLVKTNDLYYIEERIREKLNLVKLNEEAIMLPQQSPTPIIFTPTPEPNYIIWYNSLTGRKKLTE